MKIYSRDSFFYRLLTLLNFHQNTFPLKARKKSNSGTSRIDVKRPALCLARVICKICKPDGLTNFPIFSPWIICSAVIAILLMGVAARADINPWVVNSMYDPKKWDTAGPYTATPWLHPPTFTPGQGWGIFSGNWKTTGAITGSWGGVRDKLLERWGISAISAYFGQLAANPVGGVEQGASWKGDIGAAIFLDLERLVGWKRGYFTASFSYKHGTNSLSRVYIQNQFPVQLASGDDDGAARLVHLAFGQQLFNNTAEIVIGRLIAGEDFASLRLACTSLNQAICANPIAAAQSISFPVYPFATWGARIKVQPGRGWYAQAGSYLVSEDFRNPDFHGVKFSVPDGSGPLILGESGYIIGNYRGLPGLPGKYKIGGYYDGERLQELKTGNEVRGTWGIYAMGEQMLFSEDDQFNEGLWSFLALSYAPENRNRITFMAAGGLSYQGLITNRSGDVLAFVAAYGRFSGDLPSGVDESGKPLPEWDYELLLELNYRIQIAPWLFVQPDVQVVVNPDGRKDIDDALVLGFAVGTVF